MFQFSYKINLCTDSSKFLTDLDELNLLVFEVNLTNFIFLSPHEINDKLHR